jgi:hypothetical protein
VKLAYEPPREPAVPAASEDEALYALSDAGATAAVELDGYRLPVDGTGLAELHRQVVRLLGVLRSGEPEPGDDDLRAELPGIAPGATLHSWIFASYMLDLPVLVFAIDGPETSVFTRTRAESSGWPLVVLDGRDLAEPVRVRTDELAAEAQRFLDRVAADAARLASP